jgi:hypothetical protein
MKEFGVVPDTRDLVSGPVVVVCNGDVLYDPFIDWVRNYLQHNVILAAYVDARTLSSVRWLNLRLDVLHAVPRHHPELVTFARKANEKYLELVQPDDADNVPFRLVLLEGELYRVEYDERSDEEEVIEEKDMVSAYTWLTPDEQRQYNRDNT